MNGTRLCTRRACLMLLLISITCYCKTTLQMLTRQWFCFCFFLVYLICRQAADARLMVCFCLFVIIRALIPAIMYSSLLYPGGLLPELGILQKDGSRLSGTRLMTIILRLMFASPFRMLSHLCLAYLIHMCGSAACISFSRSLHKFVY